MNTPIELSPMEIAGLFLAFCGAVAAIGKAVEYIAKLISAAKKPEVKQNDRIADLEKRLSAVEGTLKDHDRFFENDKDKLDGLMDGMRILQLASLATISHAINGNDIDKLREVEHELQSYLARKCG